VDVVLIGPPGSGKSAVGHRLAARLQARFVDLDDAIEEAAGRPIPAIFEAEGEAGFRLRERAAIAALGPADPGPAVIRVIAVGGGAVVDPRSRWHLFRGRRVFSLHAAPEVLIRRLRGGRVRPLLAGRDPLARLRALVAEREPFYAAGTVVDCTRSVARVAERIAGMLHAEFGAFAEAAESAEFIENARAVGGTRLLRASTPIGVHGIGAGDALPSLLDALTDLGSICVAVISEPEAYRLHGARIAAGLAASGLEVVTLLAPRGEAAKTLAVHARLVRDLARRHLERGHPVVAIGGGALGDAAGFAAATYLRGVPLIHVPTTLVAQIDSSIGGKTAVNVPEGKNLVGAFHQPRAVVIDIDHLATLPRRQLRAALGEAIKYAALGDERLFALLEEDAAAIAHRDPRAVESGALAELVERCVLAKIEVVAADEREQAGRIALNLGHSLGHAVEAAAGFRRILHGEAVAHGLRGAVAIGRALGVTPADRAERIESLLDVAGLAVEPPDVSADVVRDLLRRDKKRASGRLRWVLPTESGVTVEAAVPDDAVEAGISAALGGPGGRVVKEQRRR
jgi:shikimate kinase / 3-dehydroquinate synthase